MEQKGRRPARIYTLLLSGCLGVPRAVNHFDETPRNRIVMSGRGRGGGCMGSGGRWEEKGEESGKMESGRRKGERKERMKREEQ